MTQPGSPPPRNRFREARAASRLAAVQALYQMELTARGWQAVVREFEDHRFSDVDEAEADAHEHDAGAQAAPADPGVRDAGDETSEDSRGDIRSASPPRARADRPFFESLVEGVVTQQAGVDAAVERVLAQGWTLRRLDATARAILRAGAYELIHRPDVPPAVAISAYVDLAHDFFEGPEPGFINGALDAIARTARASESAPAS